MARCHICDTVLEVVQFDPIGKIEPCDDCMDVVQDSLSDDAEDDLLELFGLTDDTSTPE